ncbi:MAG: hypothetical protein K8W52_29580 [Deltaproteobacteria bacterium]|nr:hypothetical protein [Deltaproteobacteria bacterium]
MLSGRFAALISLALALALVPACTAAEPVGPAVPDITSVIVDRWYPQHPTPVVDLLFVVDTSASMASAQASLAANMPAVADALAPPPRGLLSLHVGVVSADLGTGGVALGTCTHDGDDARLLTGTCAGLTAPFLEDVPLRDGQRARNYSGALADRLACATQLGTSGCAIAQPLEAMRRALDPARNPGFRRAGARLMVVLVSNQDDCSVRAPDIFAAPGTDAQKRFRCTTQGLTCAEEIATVGEKHDCVPDEASPYVHGVDEYADFLAGSGDAGAALVGVISGPASPVTVVGTLDEPALVPACSGAIGTAAPAVRLRALADRVAYPAASDVCGSDLSVALAPIAYLNKTTLEATCIGAPIVDTDAVAPGVQPECAVTEFVHRDTPEETATLLPACDATESVVPCWKVAPYSACFADGLLFSVERHGGLVEPDTVVHVQCVGASV